MIPSIGQRIPTGKTEIIWSIANASHVRSVTLNSDSKYVKGLTFTPDGNRFAVVSGYYLDYVVLYHLSSSWDITTRTSGNLDKYSMSSYETYPKDLNFDNGRYLQVIGTSSNSIWQRYCTNPWDFSSGSIPTNVCSTGNYSYSLCFYDNGTKMLTAGGSTIQEWHSSNAYLARYQSFVRSATLPFGSITQVRISNDGRWMAVCHYKTISLFELSTPGDIRTIGDPIETMSLSSYDTMYAFFISPDGTKLFTATSKSPSVLHEFNLT